MNYPVEGDDGTIGHAVYELPTGSEYLIAWTSMNLNAAPEINIYGNPKGLRALAEKLIEIADLDQTACAFPDDDSFHAHFSTGCNTEVEPPRLTIGRVDSKTDPAILLGSFPARVPEFSADKSLS